MIIHLDKINMKYKQLVTEIVEDFASKDCNWGGREYEIEPCSCDLDYVSRYFSSGDSSLSDEEEEEWEEGNTSLIILGKVIDDALEQLTYEERNR
jgi:hypothetical protein